MSAVVLRAVADALRLGKAPDFTGMTAGGLHDLGDAMLAGLEAVELVDALESEIIEEAENFDLIGDDETPSLALVWERVREQIWEQKCQLSDAAETLFAVRSALIATGSLDASDTTTDIAALITVLFGS